MKKKQTTKDTGYRLDCSIVQPPPEFPFKRPPGFKPLKYPWPLKDKSVVEAYSAHLMTRIPGPERFRFMDELWRVLEDGGKATILVPYWSSARSVQDPLAVWPPFTEQSFLYFNKEFRKVNAVDVEAKCDFDFAYGYNYDPETQSKTDDARPFWVKHYNNTANDLQIVLTKRP